MTISKTDFVRGLQCEKMLWLDAHCPQERVIPPEVQAKLDAGNDFGDKAMGIFGTFTETTSFAFFAVFSIALKEDSSSPRKIKKEEVSGTPLLRKIKR